MLQPSNIRENSRQMTFWDVFHGANAGYVQELYEKYLSDPDSVDAETRALFARWRPPMAGPTSSVPEMGATPAVDIKKVVGGVNYAEAIRQYGHLMAQIDPLGMRNIGDPSLNPTTHGITEEELRAFPASMIGGPIAAQSRDAYQAVQALRQVYTSKIGFDYEHVREPSEREWLCFTAESGQFRPPQDPINPTALLKRLTEVEAFERFIHRIFPGKHRFSIEGLDVMVPIVDEIIGASAESGVRNILIGMAHRGRLNMLTHLLGKPYASVFAEFKDPVQQGKFRDDLGWTGDVKYHLGANRALQNGQPVAMMITMAPNPSHLEFVNPVVEGMSRAAGTSAARGGAPVFNPNITLPILIHGDAAFPGQGIVAETLNLSRLPGYWTGGTIHIIANNQLGYTTEPVDSRSTIYASDLAKGFKIPVIHVNADDPEGAIEAARIAFAYLAKFQRDFVIDLVGYRRYGHNEGDEPAFTQPTLYQIIEQHPTARALWGETLVERGILEKGEPDAILNRQMDTLQGILERLDLEKDLINERPVPPPAGAAKRTKSAISAARLRELNTSLLDFPESFTLHPKLQKVVKRRQESLNDSAAKLIDWSQAEDLAMASILADGIAIRLTGQDAERGTFSQRHAVFHDYKTNAQYVPLQALPQAAASYEVHNSPLSESAALGFEYGYNVQEPGRLVLWEAQYGDFDNGAQVIIDEFLVSARAKWGQTPSLVMLLPHGYEGAGPDHSSARPERFLQMAAETNMRVANPTTAAQYFHLLRRQALLLKSDPLPLIVLTPKSLLRNALVNSSLNELVNGRWQPVIDDEGAKANADQIRRVILVSGKLYVDLVNSEAYRNRTDVAIVRVEQLYPFPINEIADVMEGYKQAEMLVWAQEEPENMGAWEFARPYLTGLASGRWMLKGITRPRNSSSAEGSSAWHIVNQAKLIEQVLGIPQQTAAVNESKVKHGV
ncbi:MAG: 2-oxoglutarate dehydrogenase E1 [Chloroflexi bacterium OLB15]|nr:MAG: 2-oxoglutarate dehydrogenase E1 [Chloroflexi bacterium OLB15]